MTLPKIKKFTDYNHYPDEAQPTTDADMQDYMLNQNDILGALTKRLWQPQTEYKLGDIVASDAMTDGLVAVCTIAGVTSDIEPTWGANEATVIDNSCTWIMRPAYCYGLATDGDVQTVYDGGEAEVSRLLSLGVLDKIFEIFKGRIGELFGDNDVLPIANGGTGATTAEQARKNLDVNGFVTGLSVSGRTITYNKKDGTSGTITTQDTIMGITQKINTSFDLSAKGSATKTISGLNANRPLFIFIYKTSTTGGVYLKFITNILGGDARYAVGMGNLGVASHITYIVMPIATSVAITFYNLYDENGSYKLYAYQ